jgi:hypothetical protein
MRSSALNSSAGRLGNQRPDDRGSDLTRATDDPAVERAQPFLRDDAPTFWRALLPAPFS